MKRDILRHLWWMTFLLSSCFGEAFSSSFHQSQNDVTSSASNSVSSLSEVSHSSDHNNEDVSSSAAPVRKRRLRLSYTTDTYYQYDTLSLNDLVVYGDTLEDDTLMTSEIITKYAAIFTDTNELITAPYWLKQAGERSIRISAQNYSPATLVLRVLPPDEFEQEIILTPPKQTTYTLYDTMDFAGLSVVLHTKRTTEKEDSEVKRILSSEEYSLTMEGKNVATPFLLNEVWKYSFLVTYRGFEATFTKDFTILVTKPNPSSPFTYRFDNLNYTKDNSKITVAFTNEKNKVRSRRQRL
ncbi:MAG: hypothetical protein PUC66_03195 [Erysipelotrichaceae bacterium]|nr:hypothetical protein [Erysipelotrichaceae bacterium]